MYANMDNWKLSPPLEKQINVLDKWALSLTNTLIKSVTADLDAYNTLSAVSKLQIFVDDISKWYIRRSRDRVGPSSDNTDDKNAFYATTYYLLKTVLQLSAPISPFLSEHLYRTLTEEESVHLSDWPKAVEEHIHPVLESSMQLARKAAEEGHAKRKADNLKVKIPVGNLEWSSDQDYSTVRPTTWDIVLKELNVKNITINGTFHYPDPPVAFTQEELQHEGELRELVREIQTQRKNLNCHVSDVVNITVPKKFKPDIEYLKKKVLAKEILLGEKVEISK
jgi:isoleucyl-tRNA synthetase